MDARGSEIAKGYIFEIPTKNFKFIAPLLLTIRNMQCVCGTHYQSFNIRLKPVVTDMRSFGQGNHNLKIMHFFVKSSDQRTYTGPTIQYVICISNLLFEAIAFTTVKFVEIKEKHPKKQSAKIVGSLH